MGPELQLGAAVPDNSPAQYNTLLSTENDLVRPYTQSNSCATRELQPYTTSHQQTQIYQRQNTTSAKHILDPNPRNDHVSALRAEFTSPPVGFGQISALPGRGFDQPADSRTWPCASASYHNAIPRATPARLEHGTPQEVNMQQSQQEHVTVERRVNDWLVSSDDDDEIDLLKEYREVLTATLAPDRKVKSNALPFFIQSSALWIKLFIFEPARLTTVMRGVVIQKRTSDEAAHERVFLLALTLSTLSNSTKYDLAGFMRFQKYASVRVRAARVALQEGQLTREGAVEAMDTCHALTSTTFKVGPLISVLNTMDMYAPIFRHACPESNEELASLPRILSTPEIEIKYFATLDVLLSFITHRPMFFRYDLRFCSPEAEELIDSEHGPGLRWAYGVPDRLTVVLAKFNTILEEGAPLSSDQVQELEVEIDECQTVITHESVMVPGSMLGRIIVQEAWKYAARIYLHMGLRGANSNDERVVKIQSKFMMLLGGIAARRNPDSFLILPLLIIGLATSSSEDKSVIISRLWGVAECQKHGTMGNDIMRMLNDIWARTTERPTVWADLRTARLRIIGM
ncbi:unnamed protein product [Rhizoctonia solani]|uniref:Uncharacterized protein n=1 Tax=Rhizoctonia solani TaxID=456999 RepID=A0A8H3B3L9_9AGAM|nr:unnamed protein product [Rhizoctonia solani]